MAYFQLRYVRDEESSIVLAVLCSAQSFRDASEQAAALGLHVISLSEQPGGGIGGWFRTTPGRSIAAVVGMVSYLVLMVRMLALWRFEVSIMWGVGLVGFLLVFLLLSRVRNRSAHKPMTLTDAVMTADKAATAHSGLVAEAIMVLIAADLLYQSLTVDANLVSKLSSVIFPGVALAGIIAAGSGRWIRRRPQGNSDAMAPTG